jgi:hypothetical protein
MDHGFKEDYSDFQLPVDHSFQDATYHIMHHQNSFDLSKAKLCNLQGDIVVLSIHDIYHRMIKVDMLLHIAL